MNQPVAEPHLMKGINADYVRADWPGKNSSGIRVFGIHVLILTDQCSSVSAGGIHMIDDRIERMNAAAITGCIFAVGDNAFMHHADGTPWRGTKPKVGDRIYFAQYAGDFVPGRDGQRYRIVEDGCISGQMIDEEDEDEA